MASLYEIDTRLLTLEEFSVDSETGEFLENEDFDKKLCQLQMELDAKIENILCWHKNLLSDSEAIDLEIKKLQKRKKSKDNLAKSLKNRVNVYFQEKCLDAEGNVDLTKLNKYKFESPRVSTSYRKSEILEITDESAILPQFKKIETTTKIDKNALKQYLKDDKIGDIDGAILVTNMSMQVK